MGLMHLVYFLAVGMHNTAWGSVPRARILLRNNNLGIVGGHMVSIKDIPFIVAINEVDAENPDHYTVFCAGTIIHERFILTAASCFEDDKPKNRSILTGTEKLTTDGVFTDVEDKFCHEDYDEGNLTNDICLLKLVSDVPFGWLIKAELPSIDFELKSGTLLNVTGWGATYVDLEMSDYLLQVTVPVLSQKRCDDLYYGFNDNQICAGRRYHDFCTGDMGGPLTINNMQVGVISGSGECGEYPGVYTRVTSYLDWIHSTINKNL